MIAQVSKPHQELLRLTEETHPDYSNISKALEKIREITDLINKSVKQTDSAKIYDQILHTVKGILVYNSLYSFSLQSSLLWHPIESW